MWESVTGGDRVRNCQVVVDASGVRAAYRKIHLFDSFGFRESDVVEPGPPVPLVIDINGFAVGLTTCYDLRFPEASLSLALASVDLITVIAGWVAGPGKARPMEARC